jgi:Baseplate J-like protein
MAAPQIALRDGTGFTTNLVFSTNEEAIVITGTVSPNTVSVQLSINGGEYVADPNLVSFVLNTFSIPNLTVYPSGIPLDFGVNTILIRTVDIVGGVSAASSVIVTRITTNTVPGTQIPTGIKVLRFRDYVQILMAKPKPLTTVVLDDSGSPVLVTADVATFLGFNVYASTSAAGATGYYKINEKHLLTPTQFEEDDISSFDDIAIWDVSAAKTVRLRISEEDEFGHESVVRLNSFHSNTTLAGKIRFTGTFQNYEFNEFVVFSHTRAGATGLINTEQFLGVADSDPLYYVVTGVYFDPTTSTEIETPYSQEVLGTPLVLDTTIRDLPGRTQGQIITDYMTAVLRVNSDISLVPGSVTRDIDIDPFASEAERIWFLLDFVHRSQSFLTLLALDNVSGSGDSDPVATSAYKQALKAALGLKSDTSVQGLIDQQFDKLAGNVNKPRLGGRQSVGTLTLYTAARPSKDIQIPAGSYAVSTADSTTGVSSQRFRIAGSYTLPTVNAEAFYNFDARRYEIKVSIIAEQAGSAGNVPAGSIKTLVGVSGLQAINGSSTVFGDDQETNADLAARALLGFASVDTGTESGYAATAAAKIGVIRHKIVKSGDALMMRDYDDVRHKHIGGKVDVWVQGVQERQVNDKFAFTFDIARDVQCQVLDATNLIFRVLDSRVTPTTPVIEILNNVSQGLGARNVTLGEDYDLSGVTIVDYQTFKLNTSILQPVTTLDDVVNADYRFQVVNKLFMTLQPVRRVVSVVGEVSGALTPDVHYKLFKTDDPLLDGESTIAHNYVAITPSGGLPSGDTITINDESHVLVGFEPEPLSSVGINTATIRVFNEARTVEYARPEASSPDFDIIAGTPTTPAKIVRTSASQIANGQEVSVDYIHDENFTVTYVVNELLLQLQEILNNKRHVTADVLVKQAVINDIDIETTVQLERGATKDKTDPILRNNVSLGLSQKNLGQGVAQSNITAKVNDSTGVEYNVLPMARMAYSDGSLKLRETVLSTAVRVPSLDSGNNLAWLLTNPLEYPTTDGGGLEVEHHGVFQDDVVMGAATLLTNVGTAANRAWIIGSGGDISGYSDDATLASNGVLPSDYVAERVRLTANRVVVSLSGSGNPVDSPSVHKYAVSYVIRGDSGAHDIDVSDMEGISLGRLTVTYRSGG